MDQILIEHNPMPAKLEVVGVYDWPIWEKEISCFPWTYESNESCYFLQGKVTVITESGETITMGEGDLVHFPKGMVCTWKIHTDVKKHYNFD